ncbi:dynamin family protein [Helicobacter pylori]|uniref:dynamin family protein n=1 Tax=Helicobacter pylori TaxID=210 RepID=UPI000FDD1C29|nr:dynamin-like GTPase family protein [Helicobacter pylori]RVZ78730.1 ATPase [Helicobacter pylori]
MSVNFFKGIFNNNSRSENHHNTEPVGLEERYDLIARILNAKMENEGLEEYQSILNNEFLEFASGVDSLKEKEIALLTLQEIKKELQLVASYPSLFQKTIVAVGGGFSAGKSTFLNNLLGLKLKLPEHIDPTTAIPTYCLKGQREVLMGFSQNGGMVELPHLAFDHQFLKSLGFNLKEIMPFMLLSAPSVPFEFLCFIDTPGYNPGNQGYTGGDEQASKESLKHAKHILWLISCERGGIESDDLEFLQELYEEESKQVFIVLSRADSRTKRQLEEIATKIKETLKDNGIEFLGIGAYSATRYQEYKEFSEKSKVFNSLEKFLIKLNQRSEKQNEILGYLYEVHSMYEKAIKQDANRFKRYQSELRSVGLDLMQKGFDDFNDAAFNKIHSLKKEFAEQEKTKRENLVQLNEVINLFKKSIDKVFDRVSAFTWEKYKAENDDEEDDEANYREFEEIKKMVLYFRDLNLFFLDWYEWSEEEIQKTRDSLDKCNELLQLDYSLKNLQRIREFKEEEDNEYQEFLNDEELQNDLREWRDLKNTPEEINRREFEEIKKMALYFRDRNLFYLDWYELSQEKIQEWRENVDYNNEFLQLDYSLKNLIELKRFKEAMNESYRSDLNNEELQNDLREWRRTKQR